MSIETAEEIIQRAKETRLRLFRPENAVTDKGINLRENRDPPPQPECIKPRIVFFNSSTRMTTTHILRIIELVYYISPESIKSDCRLQFISLFRHIAVWLCLKHTKFSTTRVGREFQRDHTSILYARDKINRILAGSGPLTIKVRDIVNHIESHINASDRD